MARSLKKGPYVEPKLVKKVQKLEEAGERGKVIRTYSRRSTILPEFVGHTFSVYNGKKFWPVFILESMVGHKLGEFSPTRTYRGLRMTSGTSG